MSGVFDEDLSKALAGTSMYFDESIWLQDHTRISYEERERFLNNEIENPLFTYRKQSIQSDYPERLADMRQCLSESKAPAVVIDLYERKLEKMLQRKDLIVASMEKDDAAFYEAGKKLHGKPKKRFFSYVAKRLLVLCHDRKKQHPNSARRLHSVVSKISTDITDIDVDMLPPVIKPGKVIGSVSEVVDVFKGVMERCGVDGWTLEVDEADTRSRFAVNTVKRVIHIPSEKQLLQRPTPLTDIQAQALAEHEIGVHVRRVHEASRGPLRLLEIGLDGYLAGEEGLASYVQQQIEGADEFYGFDRYLAACLAVGMDGEARDFRAVFSLMVDYYTLKFSADQFSHAAPFQAAWDVCVRIFRGTTGQTAGAIYTKDILYMEGNIGLWNLLSLKPDVFESLFVGKFNPMLSRHVRTLQTLDILGEW